jgi:hypothetical protein
MTDTVCVLSEARAEEEENIQLQAWFSWLPGVTD